MQKLGTVIGFSVVLFFGVVGFYMAYSMKESTVNLISGVVLGVLIAAPCFALIGYFVGRDKNQSTRFNVRLTEREQPQYELPQQYQAYPMQSGQQFPQLGQQMYPQLPARRHFIVGDDGETKEL